MSPTIISPSNRQNITPQREELAMLWTVTNTKI